MLLPPSTLPRGFTPVPRNTSLLLPKYASETPSIPTAELLARIPSTPLVERALAYLKPLLPVQIFNHSHRAFLHGAFLTFFWFGGARRDSDSEEGGELTKAWCAGVAIASVQFPEWAFDEESFFLACLFHDFGLTEFNLSKCVLLPPSFYLGIESL